MTNQQEGADVSAAVTAEQVEQVVRTSLESFGAEPDAINREAKLSDLDIDSLDLAELSQIVEEQYGVNLTSSDVKSIVTVGDAVDMIVERA
ncbi:MAG: acyl carrier protein [Solirubrobacteraceae bacterium]|jgi:acyl carrier protein|nr:acyl carrier protein [Solirubrobacteraceae bacterium]